MRRHLNRAETSHEERDGDKRYQLELNLESDRRAEAHGPPQRLEAEHGAIEPPEQWRQFAPCRDQEDNEQKRPRCRGRADPKRLGSSSFSAIPIVASAES